MKFWENPKNQGVYPDSLTAREKADIKSALLQSLANGKLHLLSYLENVKTLSDYPEAQPNVERCKRSESASANDTTSSAICS